MSAELSVWYNPKWKSTQPDVAHLNTRYVVFYLKTTHTPLGTGISLLFNPFKSQLAYHTCQQGLQYIANTLIS